VRDTGSRQTSGESTAGPALQTAEQAEGNNYEDERDPFVRALGAHGIAHVLASGIGQQKRATYKVLCAPCVPHQDSGHDTTAGRLLRNWLNPRSKRSDGSSKRPIICAEAKLRACCGEFISRHPQANSSLRNGSAAEISRGVTHGSCAVHGSCLTQPVLDFVSLLVRQFPVVYDI
jgi:hypothetical protein